MAISTNIIPCRGFLRALASLPLIGGGVSILGAPTAAATPITVELMKRYCQFLSRELLTATAELSQLYSLRAGYVPQHAVGWDLKDYRTFLDGIPPVTYVCEEGIASQIVAATPPSSRVAVVLSAVGALV